MITRAKIIEVVDGSNGYKWKVNIPILYGRPDKVEEVNEFNRYYDEQKQLKTNSTDVLNEFESSFQQSKEAEVNLLKKGYQTLADFETVASVCGIPNSKIMYKRGDTVIVGFEDNDMGKPIILGALLTAEIENNNTTKIQLSARSVSVEDELISRLDKTKFTRSDFKTNQLDSITGKQLEELVLFVQRFEELGMSLEYLSNICSKLSNSGFLGNNDK